MAKITRHNLELPERVCIPLSPPTSAATEQAQAQAERCTGHLSAPRCHTGRLPASSKAQQCPRALPKSGLPGSGTPPESLT